MAEQKISKDEQIGFHKGSITVLAKEREELLKIVAITEQLMQMHSNALTELGVKLEAPSAPVEKPKDTKTSKKVPIEHLI
jgi:hypothetical protein